MAEQRRPGRRAGWVAVAAALAVLSTAVVSSPAAAQVVDEPDVVRIVARKLESGRIEFGLQQRQADSSWGDRRLPRVRFFPTTAGVGRWLASSALSLPAGEVRIVARKLESGRVEFGLQQRQGDGSWGDRRLPRVRFFPTTAGVGRWLASSALTIGPMVDQEPDREPAVEPVGDPRDSVPPSAALFSDVAAGNQHACGLRTDGTVACWGDADFSYHSCRLVTGRDAFSLTIVCDEEPEGGYGSLSAPEGRFTAISSGKWHMCGIRTDQRVQCWTWDEEYLALTDAPEGGFVAVAAAENHTCGIRIDGTAECWSDISVQDPCTVAPGTAVECQSSTSVEIDAPAGTFTAIASGGRTECSFTPSTRALECISGSFSCGIRPDGTVDCWGSARFGRTDPPGGSFSAVSAGQYFACGIRTGGTLACWGQGYFSDGTGPDPGRPPEGTFASISVGSWWLACGVRTDGTARCWHPVSGRGDSPWSAPQGTFTRISAGHGDERYACGIRPGGTVDCWGENYNGEANPPAGEFEDIAVGARYACGVRTGGALTCWGQSGDEIGAHGDPPPGAFAAVSVGFPHACGITAGGAAQCWANRYSGGVDPPAGTFTAISAGLAASDASSFSCGIRADGTIACWGSSIAGQTDAPGGRFTSISAGAESACAIRTDGTLACWGNNNFRQATPPSGQFTAVSAGRGFACGIRIDGTVHCWGQNEFNKADAPRGTFTAISAGIDHACGIRTDGTVHCWGKEGAEAPTGTFTDISAGARRLTCGIRTDGAARCWGWTTAVPDGVRWVRPDAPAPTTTDAGQAPTTTELAEIQAAEAEMARLVNELRESLGLAPLAYNPALASVARRWSQTMRDDNNFIHNPNFMNQYPPGWQQAAENIAWVPGPTTVEKTRAAFAFLRHSPSHYANMVHPDFNQIGVGIAIDEHRLWVTQNFAYYPQ